MKIRVCDDVSDVADDWIDEIKKVIPKSIKVCRMDSAKEDIMTLINRKRNVEEGKNPLLVESVFDDIDIAIIDYDLLHLDDEGNRTTGEGVARLARFYSNCGLIAVLNQFIKEPQFDLGMRGHLHSFADINLNSELIGYPSLWSQTGIDGEFNPTTWTPLPKLVDASKWLTCKIQEVGMDAPIMPIIGLENDVLHQLSDYAYETIDQSARTDDDLAKLTIRDYLYGIIGTELTDILSKNSGNIHLNFASFRIIKWLERSVLRPLDVLIDAHHLLNRMPFLLDPVKCDPALPSDWQSAALNPKEKLKWDVLQKFYNFAASKVLGKMVFDWHKISQDEEVDEMLSLYLREECDRFYLAEDSSRFVEESDLILYRADFHNFGDRRGIEKINTITYGPNRRIIRG